MTENNSHWLACIISSWLIGKSALPDNLGLEDTAFQYLVTHYFPHSDLNKNAITGIKSDYSRMLEKNDLQQLLLRYGRDDTKETLLIANLIIAACLGNEHLWQDLGLWNRAQLSALLHYNFPKLAQRNINDMKWKKFIYKQLCEEEGLYVCRAPSCGVCIDYSKCFGLEE